MTESHNALGCDHAGFGHVFLLCIALPRPWIATSRNWLRHNRWQCAPATQAPKVRPNTALLLDGEDCLGRGNRQGRHFPCHTPSARHVSPRRKRMGNYNDPHQPRFGQIVQRAKLSLLSATHGRRVHWYDSNHRLTRLLHNLCTLKIPPRARGF